MQKTDNAISSLLDIASVKTQVRPTPQKLTEIDKFIRDCKIKEGNDRIEAMRVWFLYKKWKKQKCTKYTPFLKLLSKRFKKKRYEDGLFYLLDGTAFDLTKDGYWKYRKQLRDERKYWKKKKTQKRNNKRKNEVSSTES